jgi:predicted nucleic acid-binding protein
MRDRVFFDTSGWIAILNKTDRWHRTARDVKRRLVRQHTIFILTDYIIVEFANGFSKPPLRAVAINSIRTLIDAPEVEIIRVDAALFDAGLDLFQNRSDKTWSLTDCISFVVMKGLNIAAAFTSDHHFQQAGFSILLK